MDTQQPPRPDRAQERRQQIMRAALACFARKGYHQTTMDDIVTASGLSKGTLYWYFKSKDELFLSLVSSFFLTVRQDMDAILEQGTSPSQKLRTLTHEFTRFFDEISDFLNVFFEFWMLGALNEQLNQLFSSMLTQYQAAIAGLIEEGIQAGEFRQVDARQLALAVMAVYDGLWFYKMLMPNMVDLERAGQAFIQTFFTGLLANGQEEEG